MTRKDFQLIAEVIRDLPVDDDTRTKIAGAFARRLSTTNRAFNDARFVAVAMGYRANPALVTFGNPRRLRRNGPLHSYRGQDPNGLWLELQVVGQLSRRVFEIRYKHIVDGLNYKHKFKPNVCMEALHDGSIRVYGRNGQPVVGDF